MFRFTSKKAFARRGINQALVMLVLSAALVGVLTPPASAHSSGGINHDRRHAANRAKRQVGTRYRWGLANPKKGFDCSGLTLWAYNARGIDLPHSSLMQYKLAGTPGFKRIKLRSRLIKGDLVFFDTSKKAKVGHVGIYLGGGEMVSATTSGVAIDSVYDKYYWSKRYVGATRVTR